MGGSGCWSLATAAPDRFAAIVPVAGAGDVGGASRLVNLPIWAHHGGDDKSVPLESTMKMVEAIQAIGGKPRLTIYENTGHGICDRTFARDDLYKWLLDQHR